MLAPDPGSDPSFVVRSCAGLGEWPYICKLPPLLLGNEVGLGFLLCCSHLPS